MLGQMILGLSVGYGTLVVYCDIPVHWDRDATAGTVSLGATHVTCRLSVVGCRLSIGKI